MTYCEDPCTHLRPLPFDERGNRDLRNKDLRRQEVMYESIPVNFVQAWRWHLDTCSNVRYVKTELGRVDKLLHVDDEVNKPPHQNHHLTRRVNTLHEALQHVQRKYTARTMMNLRLSIPKTSRRKFVENGERHIINGVGNHSLCVCFVLVLISTSNSKWHHSTSHYVLIWIFCKMVAMDTP